MTYGGHTGKVLKVDLSTSAIETIEIPTEVSREYIGGSGLGVKLFFDLLNPNWDIDPLDPRNPLVIMTGPLTGVRMNAVCRIEVLAKSPQTGVLGEANVGGFIGPQIKFAGWDGIVITGASDKPVVLAIDDDRVQIRDGSAYWGMDTYEATDRIIADYRGDSNKGGQVFTIGPAGEKLLPIANMVNNKGHLAGRVGLGAVCGSKNLKALWVRGSGKPKIALPERFDVLKKELKELYDGNITIEGLRAFGTASHMDLGIISGDIPMKNWQISEWDQFDDIAPIAYGDKVLTGNKTCYSCSVACKREVAVADGPFQMEKGPGPEYETMGTFGTMLLNPSMESIAKANEICNRAGIDTITAGASIAWAMECFERGLIDTDTTGGLELTWGNSETIIQLAKQIAAGKGFGALLAKGSAAAAKELGFGEDFLSTVRGLEAPMHDPRSAHGYGLAYAVSNRGACHMNSLEYPIEGGGMYVPEIDDLCDDIEGLTSVGKAQMNIHAQNYGQFFSHCAVFCNLGSMILNLTQALEMVNAVTGFEYTQEEILELGERLWYLKRGLTNLFGSGSEDDKLSKRMMTPIQDGPTEGSAPDMELMLKEFYELRAINEKGWPARDRLIHHKLKYLADALYGS
ncbi:MAG: aldehyde ferredoxin oxidoreductase family protein [Candidatus Alcyoniella australis]|nr:aldehyde ferredoxin oxidoreductase family protein [Candidatus Alcyoniella australis]